MEFLDHPIFSQFPFVAVLLWVMHRVSVLLDQQRDRFLGFLAEKDGKTIDALHEFSAAIKDMSAQIAHLGTAVTRLEMRIAKEDREP